eukprot:894910-Pelagomonas_calceolata.AAC.1
MVVERPHPAGSTLIQNVHLANIQAVSAIKSMVVERPHPVDAPLASCVVELLLAALADADRHVRRAAVVSLSAVSDTAQAEQSLLAVVAPYL